ncbi:MAG: DUF4340 domain-containing protein [Planctomycetia bacterium]|nr:DUF4340 domain-containing protein [Planctomycetia bacterium]
MNENTKTLTFVGVAVVLLGFGVWLSRPASEADLTTAELGKEFFPDFTDPMKVASAEIIDLDAVNDVKHDLKVARVDDVWEINPDRQRFPDVSPERLANVVKAVVGVKKLAVVTDQPDRHREFAVVDPANEAELKAGTDGVGKRVTLVDADRRKLVDLIIGKNDEKNKNIVYVREPNRDRIYATELDKAPLSSSFGDWVPADLLKVGAADLRTVDIHDYAIDVRSTQQGLGGPGGLTVVRKVPVRIERAKLDAKKDDSDKWQLTKLETYDKETKGFLEKKLLPEEEFDSAKVDELKRTLAGLRIVDAVRKPKTLAADLLKEKTFLFDAQSAVTADQESMASLETTGFWPNSKTRSEIELVCHEGELTVGFENGVQYLLRFGDITGKGRAGSGGDEKKEGEPKKDDAKPGVGGAEGENTAPNRYMMVTASFNPDLIPKPPLVTLPPEGALPSAPAATPAPTGTAPAATPPAPTPTATPTATPKTTATPTPTAPTPSATPSATAPATPAPAGSVKPAEGAASGSCEPSGDACQAEPAKPEATKADAPKPSATKPEAKPEPTKPEATKPTPSATAAPAAAPKAKPSATATVPAAVPTATAAPAATTPATTAKPADTIPPAAESKPAEVKPVAEPPKPMTPEERKRIETENKRMSDKYEADLKSGREKAKELNTQFADWFYVVDDATFRALDLSPTALAKKKGAPAANPGPHGGQNLPPDLMRQIQQMQQQQQQR